MRRKVNRVGVNTLTISLPSKWAKQFDIKSGDELELKEDGSSLTIAAKVENSDREISFAIKKETPYMNRLVCAPYLKGYDKVSYSYDDQRMYAKILGSLKLAVGYEVVERKDGKCKLAEISKGADENFNQLVTRLFHVERSFLKDLVAFLRDPYEKLDDFYEYEYTADRLALYCRRLINKNIIGGKTSDLTGIYHIVCLAEQVGDQAELIVKYFEKNGHSNYKYDKSLDKIFDTIDKSLEVIEKQLYNYTGKKDTLVTVELCAKQKELRDNIRNMESHFLALKKDNVIISHYLLVIIDLIQHMSEELF